MIKDIFLFYDTSSTLGFTRCKFPVNTEVKVSQFFLWLSVFRYPLLCGIISIRWYTCIYEKPHATWYLVRHVQTSDTFPGSVIPPQVIWTHERPKVVVNVDEALQMLALQTCQISLKPEALYIVSYAVRILQVGKEDEVPEQAAPHLLPHQRLVLHLFVFTVIYRLTI